MCGIAGLFTPQRPGELAAVRAMCGRIRHRGPDDEGYYTDTACVLGMRRLSIIDLSTGHQPISNEDQTLWVVFNGEIYNYRELRDSLTARGHRFSTRSDTEVLVHLYEEYGVDGIARLRGMFAYALWDSARRRLLLARDRFGKKPLYYALLPEGLYFASELKCLRAAGIPLDLDPAALRRYFRFSYIPDPLTPFQQVKKLEPGGWLLYSETGEVQRGRYWKLPAPAGDTAVHESRESLYTRLREVFDESVRLRMLADVPLGAFLSGGIDSSSVVASMALQSPEPVKTFSVGFEEGSYNELACAQAVASRYKTDHHTLIVRPDSAQLIPRLVWHFDEPFGDSSAIPTYLVSQFAAQHVKVVLTGDGGDELFGGYPNFLAVNRHRKWDAIPHPLRRAIGAFAQGLPYRAYGKNFLWMISRRSPLERYFEFVYTQHFLSRSLLNDPWMMPFDEHELREAFPDSLLAGEADALSQALYFESTANLAGDMLVKVDRMSMANSLEVRCPMLDPELAQLAAAIPHGWKIQDGRGKHCFIEAMKDRLPEVVWNRPKRGFSVPIREWLRGPLRELLYDTLTGPRFLARGFVSPKFLRVMIQEHMDGRRDNRQPLWTLLMLELWFRQWQDTPVNSPAGALVT
jgi:asparagine synthase (glutamine-hydrolysing)